MCWEASCFTLGALGGGCKCSFGSVVLFFSQQGQHSIACMAKAFLESIEHALLRVVPTVVDWAGVLYEYLSIAMADMYSTGIGGRHHGRARLGASTGGDKMGKYRRRV